MASSKWKKTGIILAGILLISALLLWLVYYNRQRFIPEVEKITYLKADFVKGKALVHAGVQVHNQANFSLQIDSVFYQIRSQDVLLGWGSQLVSKKLPESARQELDFPLLLNLERYRKHLAQLQNQDSLELDVLLKVYLNPPFLEQQTFTLTRKIKTALPQKSTFKIDSFYVQNFNPDNGYTFVLNLNTGNTSLPAFQISDLRYNIRLSDSILVGGKIDSIINVSNSGQVIPIPVQVKTADLIGVLLKNPEANTSSPFEAEATATLKADHPLFENTAVSVKKTGTFDLSRLRNKSVAMPSVKQVKSLKFIPKEKKTYLQAAILVHNPTILPLYIDHARYMVRHKGKEIASGSNDLEKVLPVKGNQELKLDLAVNNSQFSKLSAQYQDQKEVPLEVELLLNYNLKNSKPQQISIRRNISFPVSKNPSFELVAFKVKQLNPKQGAHLVVWFKVKNEAGTAIQLDDLKYQLQLRKEIAVTGNLNQPIAIPADTTEIEIPVQLSGKDANLIAKGLVEGIESWDYAFNGTAIVSMPNSLIQQTEVNLQITGVYEIKSKGSPDFMPEISKIDTLHLTIHHDTAWVNMYAAIYNTLPTTIHVSQLQVNVLHNNETIGKTEEKLNMDLTPNANSFTWHTLGLNYGRWEKHVQENQGQDSMSLSFPASLTFDLGDLASQQAKLDLSTRIPTPVTPVTELRKMQLRGFSFGSGLKFNALIMVNNANSAGLTVKNISYLIELENGVNMQGKLSQTYKIPIGISEVSAQVNLGVWESMKLFYRQLFGPELIAYKINATAQVSTDNPKLSNVFVVFENRDQSSMRRKKNGSPSK